MMVMKRKTTIYLVLSEKNDHTYLKENNVVTAEGERLIKKGLEFSFVIVFCKEKKEAEEKRGAYRYLGHETYIVSPESMMRIIGEKA